MGAHPAEHAAERAEERLELLIEALTEGLREDLLDDVGRGVRRALVGSVESAGLSLTARPLEMPARAKLMLSRLLVISV